MKIHIFALALCCFLHLRVDGQILDLTKSLFDHQGFFETKAIKKGNYKSIEILKRSKKDGERLRSEQPYLLFRFDKNGRITDSEKYVQLRSRLDTISINYQYDGYGNVYKRTEREGPFQFAYYFIYNEDLRLSKEVKIDLKDERYDTAYIRLFDYELIPKKRIQYVRNSSGRIFKEKTSTYDYTNRLISFKENYTRSSNFKETQLEYQLEFLMKKVETNYIGSKKEKTFSFFYKKGRLNEIVYFLNKAKTKKYAVLYKSDEIESIVERDYMNKSISIYRFNYKYY